MKKFLDQRTNAQSCAAFMKLLGSSMKKRTVLILCLLILSSTHTFGQFYWEKNELDKGNDHGSDIVSDALGNTYVIGHFQDKLTFDPFGLNYQMGSEGDWNVYIAKYDPNGNYKWAIHGWSKGGAFGEGITIDESGKNIYVTGSFTETFYLGSWGVSQTSSGSSDAFFAKIDVSDPINRGTVSWLQKAGGPGEDKGMDVEYDNVSKTVFATGFFSGTAYFGNDWNRTSNGSKDIYVAILRNSDGAFNWAHSFGGKGDDEGLGITTDENGGMHVTGYYSERVTFQGVTGSVTLTSTGLSDIFFLRMMTDRTLRWVRSAGGFNEDKGLSINSDKGAFLYATGFHMDSCHFDKKVFNPIKNRDIYVVKLDTTKGSYIWVHSSGGNGDDEGRSIATNPKDGKSYVTGYFSPNASFNGTNTSINKNGFGGADIFIAQYDEDGNLICIEEAGNKFAGDVGQGITQNNAGTAFFTGYFTGTASFVNSSGAGSLTSTGNTDLFVAKFACDQSDIDPPVTCVRPECQVNEIVLNTGYDQMNNQLYNTGTFDPYWILIGAPPASGGQTYNLNTPANNIAGISAWADVRTAWNANWISAYTVPGSNAGNWFNSGLDGYTFQRCFCVCEGISSIRLNMEVLADNGAEIFLDGVSLGAITSTSTASFNNANAPLFDIDTVINTKPGIHCITIDLRNYHAASQMGLAVKGSVMPVNAGIPLMIAPACCQASGMIMGRKFNDLDCDSTLDTGEPGQAGWSIQLTNSVTGSTTTITTDNDGYYFFTGLGAGTYTVKEINQSGWTPSNNESLNGYTINLGTNESVTANFLNCRASKTNCDKVFTKLGNDSICCGYDFRITNPVAPGANLTSLTYIVTGGVVQDVMTMGCQPSSTTTIPGSTTGTLNFIGCNTSIDFFFEAMATSTTGLIQMTLITGNADGSTCTTKVEFACRPQPTLACSELKHTLTYNHPDFSNITLREFEIHNLKNPYSEISHINFTPIGLPNSLIGIDPKYYTDNNQTTPTELDPVGTYWIAPYLRLPNNPANGNFCSGAYTSVDINYTGVMRFTLAHDHSSGSWNGGLWVEIVHCDGSVCIDSVMWNNNTDVPVTGVGVDKPIFKLTAGTLVIKDFASLGQRKVRSVQILTEAADNQFFAVSGGFIGEVTKDTSIKVSKALMTPKTALFEFSEPIDISNFNKAQPINIVLTYNSDKEPELKLIYFDESNAKIGEGKGTIAITSVKKHGKVNQGTQLLNASPNPANDMMTIRYSLGKSQYIDLDLINIEGVKVLDIDEGIQSVGEHSATFDVKMLPAGNYIVRLTGESEVSSLPVIIVR